MDVIGKCPVCGDELKVTRLRCRRCDTSIEGEFSLCKFSRLSREQRQFIEVFIKCRGNIKEVEKELDISYPTVRSKLDDVISALGYAVSSTRSGADKRAVLDMLDRGEISHQEALKLLKEYSRGE